MTKPVETFTPLRAGNFRCLTWSDGPETVLFLHGLGAVGEVWGPTIGQLPTTRRYVALDQRGHGQSPSSLNLSYAAPAFVADALQTVRNLGGRVHLVGHSMGARVAILLAARYPQLLHSVAVVDIGPEASKANIEATTRSFTARPERFANSAEAIAFTFRSRTPTDVERDVFLARLRTEGDGTVTWYSSRASLVACVSRQRSRSYWREWRAITVPALYVHGGKSNEVPVPLADRMRAMNPAVNFLRLDGVGHNVPLLAPAELATSLVHFWKLASAKLA